jgi:hypothetical protein
MKHKHGRAKAARMEFTTNRKRREPARALTWEDKPRDRPNSSVE